MSFRFSSVILAVLAASVSADAGAGESLFRADATNGVITIREAHPSMLELLDRVIMREREFAALAGTDYTASIAFLGIPNAIGIDLNAAGTGATLTIPRLNFSRDFSGADEDEVPKAGWRARFDAPLVLIDKEPANPQDHVFSVRSNEAQGMELAVDYLFKRGHRRIGCLVSRSKSGNSLKRARCLEAALAARGLSPDTSPVRLVTEETYVEEVGKLMRNKPDAIFSPGGSGGIIAAYALSLYGRRIPEDISLVVSERAMISRYCIPPQTAITQDYGALAAAVDVIDARLRKQDCAADTVLDYQLIERDSVATRAG